MKKMVCLFLMAFLFSSCGAAGGAPAGSAAPAVKPPVSAAAQAQPDALPASGDAGQPGAEEQARFAQVLEDSGYVSWAIEIYPANADIQPYAVNSPGYAFPCMLASVAEWASGGEAGEGLVTGDALKQTAADLFGFTYDLQYAYEDAFTPGFYSIPPHGPTHSAELLADTLVARGDTLCVDTLVSYWDYEKGVQDTTTLRHTFTPNPGGVYFPYRLVSIELVDTTLPPVAEGVAAPPVTYDREIAGLVAVAELNLRTGPGTEYESRTMLTEGMLLYFVGDDGGGWLCTRNGWVSAEYVDLLGAVA